ncbi:MAG: carboxypeptidase-like regulatory domain-containing protein, partial [Flavobacteriaceae bacterium]
MNKRNNFSLINFKVDVKTTIQILFFVLTLGLGSSFANTGHTNTNLKVEDKTKPNAQEKFTVNGTVVDVKGVPLVGANVLEKGTSNGTLTDFDGKFELKLKGGSSTLAISYVGFLSQEVAVQERINVTIVLEEDLAELG